MTLDSSSINRAIRQLKQIKDNIQDGLNQTIDILTKDGAMVAQSAYGGMATATGTMVGEHTGRIEASGEAAVIAEFGAGDATMLSWFENPPDTPVYPGSYSESEQGSGEYAATGQWHFGGKVFTEVEPRHGLLDAKEYIEANTATVANEVIKL